MSKITLDEAALADLDKAIVMQGDKRRLFAPHTVDALIAQAREALRLQREVYESDIKWADKVVRLEQQVAELAGVLVSANVALADCNEGYAGLLALGRTYKRRIAELDEIIGRIHDAWAEEREHSEQRIAELEEALGPFAQEYVGLEAYLEDDNIDEVTVLVVGDLRHAAKVYRED